MVAYGQFENVKLEMEQLKIDILGMSEIKWTRQGYYRVIFSDDERKITGAIIILNKELGKKIIDIIHYNERTTIIKIGTKQSNAFIIQLYMTTSNHKDEEIEEMYEQISSVINGKRETI